MKKQFLSLYIALIINAGFAMNVDYGASLDSFVGLSSSDDTSVFGYEKVSIYGSLEMTQNISLAVDGFYKFSYPSDDNHVFDFTTLLATFPVGSMSFQVGRGFMSDYSGDVVAHLMDGVTVVYPLGFATLIGRIGFTGLINVNEVSFFSSSEEENVSRVVEGADLVKEFEALTLWASFYSFQDINNLSNNLSLYIGGGVNGSLNTDLYYSVRGNFQTGNYFYLDDSTEEKSGASLIAGMGVISINWFINSENALLNSLSPYLTVDFGMSSGDENIVTTSIGETQPEVIKDGVTLYSPMTSGGPGTIYSINNQNLTYFKILASASPLDNLQAQLGSTLFFRTVNGAVSDSDYETDVSGNYMGTEISLTGNYRPFSDLGVSVSGGMFFPGGTVLTSSPTGMVTVYLSLSL